MSSENKAILMSIIIAFIAGPAVTDAGQKTNATDKASRQVTKQRVVYNPPWRGAPTRTQAAATRSAAAQGNVMLIPLAPDHIGLTVSKQPTLYWYVSEVVPTRMVLTLIDEQAVKPLLEIDVDAPSNSGIQQFNLAKHGVALKAGVDYEWSVALVPDAEQRSNDVIASGVIRYTEPSPTLAAKLQAAQEADVIGIYAAEGIWYDAIDHVSAMISDNPDDDLFRQQRAALLEQVGLGDVATLDKN